MRWYLQHSIIKRQFLAYLRLDAWPDLPCDSFRIHSGFCAFNVLWSSVLSWILNSVWTQRCQSHFPSACSLSWHAPACPVLSIVPLFWDGAGGESLPQRQRRSESLVHSLFWNITAASSSLTCGADDEIWGALHTWPQVLLIELHRPLSADLAMNR